MGQLNANSFGAMAIAHFLRGRSEEAHKCASRAIQSLPGFSVLHFLQAAPLVAPGRIDEAKAAAVRGLERQPSFSVQCLVQALAIPTSLATRLAESWRAAGLPP